MNEEVDKKFEELDQFDNFFDGLEGMFEKALERHNLHVKNVLDKELYSLKVELKKQDDFDKKLEPLIEDKFSKIKEEIGSTTGDAITKAIKQQIRDSQPEMIDALYPIIGKLIQKFVNVEIEKLSENINKQIDNTFSFGTIKREFLSFFGVNEKDIILANSRPTILEEIYLIEQESGILLGTYSQSNITDHDLIAGMLTAIKSFVGDTFQKDQGKMGDLDTIGYGNFKILLANQQRYYIVAVVSGPLPREYKEKVLSYMENFYSEHLAHINSEDLQKLDFSSILKCYWEAFAHSNFFSQTTNKLTKHVKQKSNFNWKFWSW